MYSTRLIRWSGLAAMLGGLGYILPVPLYLLALELPAKLAVVVPVLWLIGLWAFYTATAERLGKLGTRALFVCFVGLGLLLVGAVIGIDTYLGNAVSWPGHGALSAGLTLIGIAAIRASAPPRWYVPPLLPGLVGL